MKGAKLGVLRENFKGSAEDIELFRKATANTVSEANLIKLSNQASDLGVSLRDQAKLFALAEDAGDKYGVGVEEGFQRVVLATEGNVRGLKDLGIQKKLYEQTVNDMAEAMGAEINQLDAETQKQIRLQAVLELSGISMEDVKNKTQDNADKLEALGVRIEEAETAMGSWIAEAIIPLIEKSGLAGSSILGIGSAAVNIIPLLGSLRLALQGVSLASLGLVGLIAAIPAGIVALGSALQEMEREQQAIEDSKKYRKGTELEFYKATGQKVPLVSPRDEKYKDPMADIKKLLMGDGTKGKIKPEEDPFISMLNRRMIFGQEFIAERQLQLELENQLTDEEIANMIRANEIKTEIFEEEKLMQEEQQFNDEMIYYSREELLNKEIELEQNRYEVMEQLRRAETQDEVENLKKQKQTIDRRIENIKREVEARDEFAKQGILAGVQMYDSARSLGEQLKQVARDSIKRIIAEAVATQLAKVIAMIPWPFNLIAAPAAGLAVSALFERLIPPFAMGGMINGKRHSSGGTLINAEGGEFIVNRESTRNNIELLEAINSGRDVALSGGSSVEVIRAINNLGSDIRQLQLIAKINPRDFDEGYSDYLLKKNHTG